MRHSRIQKTSKHKKIKAIDPFYAGPRRDVIYRSEKNANQAPSASTSGQEIPRKLRELMKMKESWKKDAAKPKKKRPIPSTKTEEQFPQFKQGKYETLSHFYRRMDKAASEAITKAELEKQFDVQFEKKGKKKLIAVKKEDPVKDGEAEPKISKSQKRKEKLKAKLQQEEQMEQNNEKPNKLMDFEDLSDKVSFGEIVQEPPVIKSAPRRAPEIKTMGEKDLLLKKSLHPESEADDLSSKSIFNLPIRSTSVSIAAARKEELRQNAVTAYRLLKKKKSMYLSKTQDAD